MLELTSTRANPLVDPTLHVWAWQIPVYLFLGGLVAGLMAIVGWSLLTRRKRAPDSVVLVLPLLSLVLLSLGMGALFLDLEHKPFVWRLYATFQPTSPMSWGAWILIAVYPALGAAMLLGLPPALRERLPAVGALADRVASLPGFERLVATANLVLGGLLGIYTGVLLSSLGARPLWNSALLGPLFLLSGLSSAAALAHLLARDPSESSWLVRADNRFLQAELVVLALFLIGLLTSTRAHARAAGMLLGGPFTAVFWVGVVGVGILVPLFVQSLAAADHRVRHTSVAPALVMAGGVLLRFIIVNAGQLSRWNPY